MHSTWSLQHAFLHRSRLLDLLDSHGPSNPHFEGELQDLWRKKHLKLSSTKKVIIYNKTSGGSLMLDSLIDSL